MNKARRKSNRKSVAKRLVRESLVLSTTRVASSRAVRFFQIGAASRLLTSVKKTDSLAERRINPLFKKDELRKNPSMHWRNSIASFCCKNKFFKSLSSIRVSLLNSSARSVGIFLLTFGIYAMAVILLKRFVNLNLGEATADDLIVSALAAVAGILLTVFGDKSNIEILGGGKIVGSLLSGVLGVNDSSLDKIPQRHPKTGASIGFLLGSISGALTAFSSPSGVILVIISIGMLSAIICMPEFGMLLTIALLSVLPIGWVSAISFVTLLSYIIKCLRLKRNFHFGTADMLMLALFIITPFCGVGIQGVLAGGGYLLCGMALYFVARNLICTKRLILQTFNALCVGSFCGMVIYIIGEFSALIPHEQIRITATTISQNALSLDMLAVLTAISLPFALSSFSSHGTGQRNLLYLAVMVACALLSGSLAFCLLTAISICVFVATAYKAPVGALISAIVSLTFLVGYGTLFAFSSQASPFAKIGFDKALGLSWDFTVSSFWGGFTALNGILCTLILVAVVFLALQRIFATAVLKRSENTTLIGGTVAASAVMTVSCMTMFNMLSDLRMSAVLWFIFGMCGSVYTVLYKNDVEEV